MVMQKIKTQLRRLSYFLKKDYFTLSNITLALAFIICISWTWGAISSVSRNWTLEQKLSSRQLEASKLKVEVEKLKLEQQYYQTNEYQELAARAKLNKMLPGEKLVILPSNSDTAKNKYQETTETTPIIKSNLSQWLDFLFG